MNLTNCVIYKKMYFASILEFMSARCVTLEYFGHYPSTLARLVSKKIQQCIEYVERKKI